MIDQKIIDKIQKLLNLEEGARAVGSLAEAENAAKRVQEFLLKYNLDLETVRVSKIEQKADMDNITIMTEDKQDKREANWVTKLYVAIARNNLCRIFTWDDRVQILGHKVNVMIVAYMVEQLIDKIRISEKLSWKSYTGVEKRGTFRRGFFYGAVIGINSQLVNQKEEMMSGYDNPLAVAVVHREEEVTEYMYNLYPVLRPTPIDPDAKPIKARKVKPRKGPKGLSSNDGWSIGYEVGKSMQINKGVETPSTKGNIN